MRNDKSPQREMPLWVIAATVTVAMAVLPILWVLVEAALSKWGVLIAPIDLSTLGAIAGAIFTAGGLVVALVSLFTLFSMRRIVDDRVAKLGNTIPGLINARLQTSLRAYNKILDAQDVIRRTPGAVAYAEPLIEQALTIDASLAGARAWMGDQFYAAARNEFLSLHMDGITASSGPAHDAIAPLVMRAIHWYQQAKADPEGNLDPPIARLAELYGMASGTYREMTDCIRDLVARHQLALFDHDTSRAFLAAGCGMNQSRLVEVANLLKQAFPWTRDQLVAEWQAYQRARIAAETTAPMLHVWAIARTVADDNPLIPGLVKLGGVGHEDEGKAFWRLAKQQGGIIRDGGIPKIEYDEKGVMTEGQALSGDELIRTVHEKFLIIGRAEMAPAESAIDFR